MSLEMTRWSLGGRAALTSDSLLRWGSCVLAGVSNPLWGFPASRLPAVLLLHTASPPPLGRAAEGVQAPPHGPRVSCTLC